VNLSTQSFICFFSPRFFLIFVFQVTQKSFGFAKKNGMPFYFVSAADGTNVVEVRAACAAHTHTHTHVLALFGVRLATSARSSA
jgi:hypothetical protein